MCMMQTLFSCSLYFFYAYAGTLLGGLAVTGGGGGLAVSWRLLAAHSVSREDQRLQGSSRRFNVGSLFGMVGDFGGGRRQDETGW